MWKFLTDNCCIDDLCEGTCMVTWVLTFQLASGATFLGGEYQSLARCEQGALQQLDHWKRFYGRYLSWRCEQKQP